MSSEKEFNEWFNNFIEASGFNKSDLNEFDVAYIKWWEFDKNKERFKFQIENECLNDSALKRIYSIEFFTGKEHSETELIYLNQVLSSHELEAKLDEKDKEIEKLEQLLKKSNKEKEDAHLWICENRKWDLFKNRIHEIDIKDKEIERLNSKVHERDLVLKTWQPLSDYIQKNKIGRLGDFYGDIAMEEIERLKAENEKLMKCAEYYANERNWLSVQVGYGNEVMIHFDDANMIKTDDSPTRTGGKLARQTLREVASEKSL